MEDVPFAFYESQILCTCCGVYRSLREQPTQTVAEGVLVKNEIILLAGSQQLTTSKSIPWKNNTFSENILELFIPKYSVIACPFSPSGYPYEHVHKYLLT